MEKNLASYLTPDGDGFYHVYLSDLEDYWVEEFGQEDWDNTDFREIDMIIQQDNPELYYRDRGSDDRGQYLLYATDEDYTE